MPKITTATQEKITACPLPAVLGLNREQAASFIGVSVSLFDQMVKDGRMPMPKRANSRLLWDRRSLERAFTRLPGGDDDDEGWDFA